MSGKKKKKTVVQPRLFSRRERERGVSSLSLQSLEMKKRGSLFEIEKKTKKKEEKEESAGRKERTTDEKQQNVNGGGKGRAKERDEEGEKRRN